MKCSSCNSQLVQGSLFCDKCGATQSNIQVSRKLRQGSFDSVKDTQGGILVPGERLKSRKHTYLIEEAIARSGFGATFRAVRIHDEKQILIKQMLEQSSYDKVKDEIIKSFKREAQFLRKVRHPAFPQGHEFFERNHSHFLVMDFINGKELAQALEDYRKANGLISDGIVVHLGIEIADALEIIHLSGYVYRDLKPQNVMLDGISSKVKLIDFGTLYHPSDHAPLLFESEGYTPKEFLDASSPFKASGDIYSLGSLLFEAICGHIPKPGEKIKGRDPKLSEIIEKCLKPDPSQRYQRAKHVRDDLQRLTRKGFWPFRNRNHISPAEISVLPKTLFPKTCTFCEFCGFADPNSDIGYCKKCRVPLKVGKISWLDSKIEKEFYLFSDETTIGSASISHIMFKDKKNLSGKHLRIFRRKNSMWLEAIDSQTELPSIHRRRILGPIELLDGDTIHLLDLSLKFTLREAC